MLHKLTDKLKTKCDRPEMIIWDQADKIIRQYLEECVRNLSPKHPMELTAFSRSKLMEILGLEPEKKEEPITNPVCSAHLIESCFRCWPKSKETPYLDEGKEEPKGSGEKCPHVFESDCHGIEMIKDPDGKEWAIGGTDTTGRWKFDPWCGGTLPRPKEIGLREKLAEKFRYESDNGENWDADKLADIAIRTIKEEVANGD